MEVGDDDRDDNLSTTAARLIRSFTGCLGNSQDKTCHVPNMPNAKQCCKMPVESTNMHFIYLGQIGRSLFPNLDLAQTSRDSAQFLSNHAIILFAVTIDDDDNDI